MFFRDFGSMSTKIIHRSQQVLTDKNTHFSCLSSSREISYLLSQITHWLSLRMWSPLLLTFKFRLIWMCLCPFGIFCFGLTHSVSLFLLDSSSTFLPSHSPVLPSVQLCNSHEWCILPYSDKGPVVDPGVWTWQRKNTSMVIKRSSFFSFLFPFRFLVSTCAWGLIIEIL